MYAVTVNIWTWSDAWTVPTFYLDESVQGITSETHAEQIALEVVDPLGQLDRTTYQISVTAVKLTNA